MNKNIIALAATAFAFAALMSGCSDSDMNNEEGYGQMSLVPTLKAAASDASADVPEAESLMVWISNSRGLMRRYNSLSEIPASVTLRAGHYVAEGWAGDSVPASFTSRYFTGVSEFDVTVGNKTNVDLTCRIANAVVSVEYSDDADEVMTDYSLTVANGGGSVEFEGRDTRKAYFMMAKGETVLTYTLSGTKVTGESFTQTGEITGVKAATEYKLTVSPGEVESSEGAAFFTIAVDSSTIDEETEIVITLSPEIVGKNFDIETGVSADPGEFSDVTIESYASAEIKSFTIECLALSSVLGAESIDLFALTPEAGEALKAIGLDYTYKYYADTDMSSFSLTFGAQLLNSLSGGEYPITLTCTDANEKITRVELTITVIGGADVPVLPVAIDGTADVWATHATLRGTIAGESSDFGFRYRQSGTSEWTSVAAVADDSTFSVEVTGLNPGTEYEFIVTADDYVGTVVRKFTTESALSIPNGDFETWNTSSSPYLLASSTDTRFWDSGNHGSSTMNKNITTPESTIKHGGEYSAKLSSQFVGVGSFIGKFAAGNAFVGQYLATDGTDGVIGMGRPFASRPSALKGYVRYEPSTVTYSSTSALAKGDMDMGVVYVALIADEELETYNDTSWPFVIRTKESERRLFDSTDSRVVAFGEMVLTETTEGDGLVEFNLPLEYYRPDTKAAYLMIVCSASYYGDYFTGGPSVMYIDDFSFEY